MRSLSSLRGSRAWRCIPVALAFLVSADPVTARSKSDNEMDAQRYYRLGQTQFDQGKTLQAIESLKKALSIDPKLAEAHDYLGLIYLEQSDPRKAAKHLEKAVSINPYFTEAHNTLGVAYKELKKYDRSMEEFETALKDKTYSTPEKIYLNIGYLHLERGKIPEATRSFEQALRIKPDYLRGMLGLGQAYQQSGRADLATKEFQRIVKLGPDSAEAAQARQLLDGQVKREGS